VALTTFLPRQFVIHGNSLLGPIINTNN